MNNIEGSLRHESLVYIAGIVRHNKMVAKLFMTARCSRHVTRAMFPLCGSSIEFCKLAKDTMEKIIDFLMPVLLDRLYDGNPKYMF